MKTSLVQHVLANYHCIMLVSYIARVATHLLQHVVPSALLQYMLCTNDKDQLSNPIKSSCIILLFCVLAFSLSLPKTRQIFLNYACLTGV